MGASAGGAPWAAEPCHALDGDHAFMFKRMFPNFSKPLLWQARGENGRDVTA